MEVEVHEEKEVEAEVDDEKEMEEEVGWRWRLN